MRSMRQGRTRRAGPALATAGAVVAVLGLFAGSASAAYRVPVGESTVASSPFRAGGYPVPAGATAPSPGTCRLGDYNSNRSESWIAVKPGTEDLVGSSKVFFENFSTFYDFHLGSYAIQNGAPVGNNIVQGYECVSTGTQEMPPSWMLDTDPTVDFDTQGRAYQVTLPVNPWWVSGINPDAAIGFSYSDDLGRHWVNGNAGQPLDRATSASSFTAGGVEDKQWLAVNKVPGNRYRDHIYAAWGVFDGFGNPTPSHIKYAVSRDRGQTFSAPQFLPIPRGAGANPSVVIPAVGGDGVVYVAFVTTLPTDPSTGSIWVARSGDDGVTWTDFTEVARGLKWPAKLSNTRFRIGALTENFAASPDHPGHLYMVWGQWDGTQTDVMFSQSTNGGRQWSEPIKVNDNNDLTTDQFQPQVAAGPGGAVAVNFYDRRLNCPNDPSVLKANRGTSNFCIDATLQAFKDNGSGAVPVGANRRISQFSWDPEQPGQTVHGLSQYPCAGHRDPCPDGLGFIGDYFGLAVSQNNIYSLSVSTHYPSGVTADPGGPVYYQQQVLSKVPRADIANGY